MGSMRPTLLLLLGAVAFVLLIACANVASLLLARATAREQELTVRATLGADRNRLTRQLLTECLLISSVGAAAGTALTYAAIRLLSILGPATIPELREMRLDTGVISVAFGLTLVTALAFGLWPAREAGRLVGGLHESMRTATASKRHARSRQLLIIAEVSVSLVLLIGAVMLIASLRRVQHVDPGFQPDHLFTASLVLPGSKYSPGSR